MYMGILQWIGTCIYINHMHICPLLLSKRSLSVHQKTHAYHTLKDDVVEEVKKRRLQEVITTFYSFVGDRNRRLIGTHQLVLVEGVSLVIVQCHVHVYISTA